ncbi:hypothetical protein ABE178_25315 [Priestia megaterium]
MSYSRKSRGCSCSTLSNINPGTGITLGFGGLPFSTTVANSKKKGQCPTFISSTNGITIADCEKIKFVSFRSL